MADTTRALVITTQRGVTAKVQDNCLRVIELYSHTSSPIIARRDAIIALDTGFRRGGERLILELRADPRCADRALRQGERLVRLREVSVSNDTSGRSSTTL